MDAQVHNIRTAVQPRGSQSRENGTEGMEQTSSTDPQTLLIYLMTYLFLVTLTVLSFFMLFTLFIPLYPLTIILLVSEYPALAALFRCLPKWPHFLFPQTTSTLRPRRSRCLSIISTLFSLPPLLTRCILYISLSTVIPSVKVMIVMICICVIERLGKVIGIGRNRVVGDIVKKLMISVQIIYILCGLAMYVIWNYGKWDNRSPFDWVRLMMYFTMCPILLVIFVAWILTSLRTAEKEKNCFVPSIIIFGLLFLLKTAIFIFFQLSSSGLEQFLYQKDSQLLIYSTGIFAPLFLLFLFIFFYLRHHLK